MTLEWSMPINDPRIPRSVWIEAELIMNDRIRHFIAEQDITVHMGDRSYTIIQPDMEKITMSFSYGQTPPEETS